MKINWKNLALFSLGLLVLMAIEHIIFVTPPLWTIIFYIAWGFASVPLIGPIFVWSK